MGVCEGVQLSACVFRCAWGKVCRGMQWGGV